MKLYFIVIKFHLITMKEDWQNVDSCWLMSRVNYTIVMHI